MSAQQGFSGSTGYTEAELLRMQRDAIRRVREMQSRARDFEQARRAAAGEGLIPRPTLTGNPIGRGTAAPPAAEVVQPSAAPPETTPTAAQPPHPPEAAQQLYRGGPAYRGPRHAGQPEGAAATTGGLLGSLGGLSGLFSGQGIAGIGQNLSGFINGLSDPVKQALNSLGLDNERLLIILIMLLVFTQDEYDNILLLALGYLLF
jgi:hypothetical protein